MPDKKQIVRDDEFNDKEEIELDLFLQALYRLLGYDFRHYARDSIKRRVKALAISQNLPHISSLMPLLAYDLDFQAEIINELTISYSTLFRDPFVYNQLQKTVFPYLASFPRITIWIAGCANGEEAYSIAILLHEAGLLERTRIYASDISQKALDSAASGILNRPLDAETAMRYRLSSGQQSILEYFTSAYGKHKLNSSLLSKIHFEKHNLIQQPSFISAELILCRNVLIYFNQKFQQQTLSNLMSALIDKGYLVIGTQETMDGIAKKTDLDTIDRDAGIYQKPLQLSTE
ncbi:MAG: CheR family methyltransferase [Methylococcaceae bacterium]